jgi:hypothetical protein
MRITTFLNRTIGLVGLWVKGVRFEKPLGEEDEVVVIEIRRRFHLLTCPECGTQVRGRFEEKKRCWRHVGFWGHRTYLEGPIRRLRCPQCRAVRTEEVPWARPGSWFTRAFEDAVGLLAQQLNHTAVAELTGISWATVGSIAERLVDENLHEDRFEDLRRIGVDEISYRKHHKYLTVVVDHDRDRVIWVGEGKSSETLAKFFEELGPERARCLEQASIDMSAGYEKCIRLYAPRPRSSSIAFTWPGSPTTPLRRSAARRPESSNPPSAQRSKEPAGLCSSGANGLMLIKQPPWPASSARTPPCTGRVCSRRASSRSSPPRAARKPNNASRNGSLGPLAPGSNPSFDSGAPYADTSKESSLSSSPDSPTLAWRA